MEQERLAKKTFRKNTDVLWVDVFDFYTAVTTGE